MWSVRDLVLNAGVGDSSKHESAEGRIQSRDVYIADIEVPLYYHKVPVLCEDIRRVTIFRATQKYTSCA